mmetsp:Transcript_78711/g.218673  ORF Transcript_78711/g.218673 Transcript_78711/m.218673 type:complete len:209 (+) Transcript_78711:457-1083(+)
MWKIEGFCADALRGGGTCTVIELKLELSHLAAIFQRHRARRTGREADSRGRGGLLVSTGIPAVAACANAASANAFLSSLSVASNSNADAAVVLGHRRGIASAGLLAAHLILHRLLDRLLSSRRLGAALRLRRRLCQLSLSTEAKVFLLQSLDLGTLLLVHRAQPVEPPGEPFFLGFLLVHRFDQPSNATFHGRRRVASRAVPDFVRRL